MTDIPNILASMYSTRKSCRLYNKRPAPEPDPNPPGPQKKKQQKKKPGWYYVHTKIRRVALGSGAKVP